MHLSDRRILETIDEFRINENKIYNANIMIYTGLQVIVINVHAYQA